MRRSVVALATLGLVLCAAPASAQDANDGAEGYKLCAGCHGFSGEGNRLVDAPSLAGRESWYLERQIRNFRDGLRGHGDDDAPGRNMAAMMAGLTSDEDILDIVAYIETLPAADHEPTVEGDAGNGQTVYATCIACHGAEGEGNAVLNAPALAGVEDWYQLAQLQKFRNGTRGGDSADVYGMQMAPMARALGDEQAMRDVVAYIASLGASSR